jgi:hypothetical protein
MNNLNFEITECFLTDLKKLKPGKLIQSRFFKLNDAVSAIPIMDKRVDTGVQVEANGRFTTAEASKPLDLNEIISICDLIFASKMKYLQGMNVAQTIFSCVFVANHENVKSTLLYNFIKMAKFNVYLMRNIIIERGLFFEEDFHSDLCGFPIEKAYPKEFDEILNKLRECVSRNDTLGFRMIDSCGYDEANFANIGSALLSRFELIKVL